MIRRGVVSQKMREVFSYKDSVYKSFYDKNKIIYIHIPKAAGTSISEALYGGDPWHYSALECRFINKQKFNDYFKFSFTRNPWGRMYSTYKYAKIDAKKYRNSSLQFVTQYSTFEEFILTGLTKDLVENHYFFWTQYKYLFINNEFSMDFIGKLENMDENIEELKDLIGLKDFKVKKINQTVQSKTLEDIYSKEMIEKVAEIYKEDLKAFSYEPNEIKNYK